MQIEISYFSAFLIALLGGVHCFGMCGGIVGVLTMGLASETRARFTSILPYILAYNAGRVLSYTVAGILAGGIGAWVAGLISVQRGQQALQLLAGMFMVMLGLNLGEWWQGLLRVERVGGILWRWLEPVRGRLLPVNTVPQALIMGVVWGWLPCGLVYSVLIWAVSSGGAREGALLMLSFGLGTLPVLLSMGAAAGALAGFVAKRWARRTAGGLIISFGSYQILLVVPMLLQ